MSLLILNPGNVGYVTGCPNIDLFIQEGAAFTAGERAHDDTLDGYYLANLGSFQPRNADIDYLIAMHKEAQNEPQKARKLTAWTI